MPLLILFILIPIAEITLFIQIGEQIGLAWTIASVLFTAFLGTYLVRSQGLRAWTRAQTSLQHQQIPLEEVFTGVCLLVAGALLLTPGFLTDTIGFCLLFPPLRKVMGGKIVNMLKNRAQFQFSAGPRPGAGSGNGAGAQGFHHFHAHPGTRRPEGGRDDIIEGDFKIVDDDQTEPAGESDAGSRSRLDRKS